MALRADGGTIVDPTDHETVRSHLERFAGSDAVAERDSGAVVADFGGGTYVKVYPDGRLETGMPLHEFAGHAETLVFDHETGELHVTRADDGLEYTFRRP